MKLEVGKRYLRGDGQTTGLLKINPNHEDRDAYPFYDPHSSDSYTREGMWSTCGHTPNFDLIQEVTLPPENIPGEIPPEVEKPKSANDVQHGGDHYKSQAIQPWDYITSNNLGFLEGNAVKYLSRWRQKNGIEDLKKAIHYIEKLIEVETANQSK